MDNKIKIGSVATIGIILLVVLGLYLYQPALFLNEKDAKIILSDELENKIDIGMNPSASIEILNFTSKNGSQANADFIGYVSARTRDASMKFTHAKLTGKAVYTHTNNGWEVNVTDIDVKPDN